MNKLKCCNDNCDQGRECPLRALKFQTVLQARFGVEVVAKMVFGKFETRLEAEQAVENAESNNAAIERKEVLTKLYPGSIITTHVELIKGV